MNIDRQLRRMQEIEDRVRRSTRITINALATDMGVSTMTIRRDLEKLEARGVLARICGGAIAVEGTHAAVSLPAADTPAKTAIGRLAASLVAPGQTVIVDAGTTTLEVVRHLPRQAGITLVTNSLAAAREVPGTGINLLLLGGYISTDLVRIYGPMTEACLAQLHADLLFVGCVAAGSTRGFFMSDLYLTSNVQAMRQAVERTVVVAESDKFQYRSLSCYALPREIQVLVTDAGLPSSDRAALEEQGVQVLIAEV